MVVRVTSSPLSTSELHVVKYLSSDLCNEHNVAGYPQMNLYRNGDFVETFRGSREHFILTQYLAKHAERDEPLPDPAKGTDKQAEKTSSEEIHRPSPESNPNPNGMVIALDSSTFNAALNEGPVFVKFYAPW